MMTYLMTYPRICRILRYFCCGMLSEYKRPLSVIMSYFFANDNSNILLDNYMSNFFAKRKQFFQEFIQKHFNDSKFHPLASVTKPNNKSWYYYVQNKYINLSLLLKSAFIINYKSFLEFLFSLNNLSISIGY